MGINVVDQNFAAQQMAQAMNASLSSAVKDIDRKDDEKRTEDRSLTRQLLDSKNPAKKGRSILSNLVAKLAGEYKLSSKTETKRSVKDEHDLLFQNSEDSEDKVELQSKKIIKKLKKYSKQNQRQSKQALAEKQSDSKAGVRKYSKAYMSMLLSGGGKHKKVLQKQKYDLMQKGITQKQVMGLQHDIKRTLRAQLAGQIKEGILKKLLSPDKSIEKVMNEASLDKTITSAFNNKELGGWDFGGYNKSLQGTVDAKLSEAIAEIKDYTTEEIERTMTATNLGREGAEKELHKLLELASKVGFDAQEFLKNWEVKAHDIGLVQVPYQGEMQAETGTDSDSQDNHTPSEFAFNQNDEKDIGINQLRACYMKRALNGNFRTFFETSFRMRKLKNGLIKLGVQFGDFEQIEKEGREIAAEKLKQMLQEALYERATLYELAGPAYKLINRRIKGITKNLEKLGVVIGSSEFKNLIDSANRSMFDTARHEFEQTKIVYETYPNPIAEKNLALLIKLLNRLIEESKIETSLDLNVIKKAAA
ncbi:MAG: hypothetical protein HQ564_06725 [Candidatus Saganbacteria bacterium]|nr:hypothetical protein [Candidatus Saganbacteria bacterium]